VFLGEPFLARRLGLRALALALVGELGAFADHALLRGGGFADRRDGGAGEGAGRVSEIAPTGERGRRRRLLRLMRRPARADVGQDVGVGRRRSRAAAAASAVHRGPRVGARARQAPLVRRLRPQAVLHGGPETARARDGGGVPETVENLEPVVVVFVVVDDDGVADVRLVGIRGVRRETPAVGVPGIEGIRRESPAAATATVAVPLGGG
jgi:hypothetical protein